MKSRATNEALAARFAACIARGMSQADAFRSIRPRSRAWTAGAVADGATQFAHRPQVAEAIRTMLAKASASDLLSIGAWTDNTKRLLAVSEAAGNLNATQAFNRQLGQSCRALGADVVSINLSDHQDDAAVIERLAKGDPAVAAMLTKVIGKASFDS